MTVTKRDTLYFGHDYIKAEEFNACFSGMREKLSQSFQDDIAPLRRYLDGGGDVDWPIEQGITALYLAAEEGHLDTVNMLIAHGAAINHQSEQGAGLFCATALLGNIQRPKIMKKT